MQLSIIRVPLLCGRYYSCTLTFALVAAFCQRTKYIYLRRF